MFNKSPGDYWKMEDVLPGKTFWTDPLEDASSWQCDGVGDQG